MIQISKTLADGTTLVIAGDTAEEFRDELREITGGSEDAVDRVLDLFEQFHLTDTEVVTPDVRRLQIGEQPPAGAVFVIRNGGAL